MFKTPGFLRLGVPLAWPVLFPETLANAVTHTTSFMESDSVSGVELCSAATVSAEGPEHCGSLVLPDLCQVNRHAFFRSVERDCVPAPHGFVVDMPCVQDKLMQHMIFRIDDPVLRNAMLFV